jgi:hypothetical protein
MVSNLKTMVIYYYILTLEKVGTAFIYRGNLPQYLHLLGLKYHGKLLLYVSLPP